MLLASAHLDPISQVDAKDRYQQDLRARQEELERQQKEEEDRLFSKFENERRAAAQEANRLVQICVLLMG